MPLRCRFCCTASRTKVWVSHLRYLTLIGLILGLLGCGKKLSHPEIGSLQHGYLTPRNVAPLFSPTLAHDLLDDPARVKWEKPLEIVREMHLAKGATVADIGAGSGFLLPYLSKGVGEPGRVYAEEIQDEFIPKLTHLAQKLGNTSVVSGAPEDPKLPTKVDAFVLLTVYHEVEHPVDFLNTLKAYAKPNAQLVIIDFDKNRKGIPKAPEGHEVAEKAVIEEAQAAGWTLDRRVELISSQFYLIFKRK